MANGNYTNAYATVQPTGFDGQEWLHKEQKRQEEIDKIAAERKKAKEDAFKDDTKFTVKIDPSEIKSVNEFKMLAYDVIKEEAWNNIQTMDKYKDNPQSPEYRQAKLNLDRINNNSATSVNLMTKAWESEFAKGLDKTNLLTENQKNKILSYNTKPMTMAMQNGELVIKRDTDGDPNTLEYLDVQDFLNGQLLGNVYKDIDPVDFVTKTKVGDVKIEEAVGRLREDTTVNAWNDNVLDAGNGKMMSLKDMTTNTFQNLIYDKDGNLNDTGKSLAGKFGLWDADGNVDEQNQQILLDKLVENKRAELGFETGVNQDQPRSTGGRGGSGKNEIKYSVNPTPYRTTFGAWIKDIPSKEVNSVSFNFKNDNKGDLTLKTKTGDDITATDVKALTLNKFGWYVAVVETTPDKGGSVDKLDMIKRLKAKGISNPTEAQINKALAEAENTASKTTKTKVIELDPDQANLIAVRAGIDIGELNNAIMKEGYDVPAHIPIKGNPKKQNQSSTTFKFDAYGNRIK